MGDYEILKTQFGEFLVRMDKDGTIWSIPQDPANSDYQAYLVWVAKQEAKDIK